MVSCQTNDKKSASTDEADEIHFGKKITEDGAVTVDKALDMLNNFEEVETKIVGTVESVCQAKGCWMNVVADGDEAKSFFVKFEDYGFFMPLDLSGSKIVMEGKAYKELTPVDELRHYAEDEGASKEEIEAITEPKEEYKFMATGVKIVERI